MRNQKRFNLSNFFFIALLFLFSSSLFAQQRNGAPRIPTEERINQMVEDLSIELSLSEDQKTNILDLYINHFAEVKEKMKIDREEQKFKREKMKNHRKAFENKVKSLLNEEQQEQYEEFVENHRSKSKQGLRHQ